MSRAIAAFKGRDPRAVMADQARLGGFITQPVARLPVDAVDLAHVERELPTIGRGIAVISEDSASVPLRLNRVSPDGTTHTAINDHDALTLFRHINPTSSPFEYWVSVVKDLLVFGNHYDHVELDTETGVPLSLWRLPAHQTRPVPDQNNIIRGYTWDRPDGVTENYRVEEILHYKTANIWDPYIGIPVLDRLRGSIVLERQMRRWNYSRFKNQLPANLLLLTDRVFNNEEQLDEIKAMFKQKLAGVDNAAEPLILQGESWKVEKLDRPSDEDIAFLAGLKFLRSEVAMVLGIPPSKLSDFSDAFRSNAKEQDRTYWEDTIESWHRLILDMLNTIFLPRYFPSARRLQFAYDYTGVKALAISEFQMAQTEEVRVRNGIISRNEARLSHGRDRRPEPEADMLLHNGQKLGEKPQQQPTGDPNEGTGGTPGDEPTVGDPEMDGKGGSWNEIWAEGSLR